MRWGAVKCANMEFMKTAKPNIKNTKTITVKQAETAFHKLQEPKGWEGVEVLLEASHEATWQYVHWLKMRDEQDELYTCKVTECRATGELDMRTDHKGRVILTRTSQWNRKRSRQLMPEDISDDYSRLAKLIEQTDAEAKERELLYKQHQLAWEKYREFEMRLENARSAGKKLHALLGRGQWIVGGSKTRSRVVRILADSNVSVRYATQREVSENYQGLLPSGEDESSHSSSEDS